MIPSHAPDEAEIRARIVVLVRAIGTGELEGVKSMYAADVVSFDLEAALQHLGAEAKQRNWIKFFSLFQAPVGYEPYGLTVAVSGDVAFAHSHNRVSARMENGDRLDYWVRRTICFRKVEGNWVIVHDHVSAPIDPTGGPRC